MDHIHLAIKVSKPKVNIAHRLLVAVPAEDHVWFEDRWMVASLCDE
jgi:adenosylmethionine-8-amino-7-oxononanoate aminotransferase